MKITRLVLRNEIYAHLLDEIVSQRIKDGEKLKDTEWAASIGVSRVPVREALVQLENEGYLENEPGKGFRVTRLLKSEALELYPVLSRLECLALELSEPLGKDQLQLLKKLTGDMKAGNLSKRKLVELDTRFHEVVVSQCSNTYLLGILRDTRRRVMRYEIRYMALDKPVSTSVEEHQNLIKALEKKDSKAGTRIVLQHWERGLNEVLDAIEQ